MPSLTEELAAWASGLRLEDVPARVVRLATSQVLSQLAAARGGLAHPLGDSVVQAFGQPLQADPQRTACALAGLTAWLSFDDTAYAGHLSNSTVNVPVAYALALGLDGAALLGSVICANECAARITAATTLGPFRGQNATHTHLAGSVTGRLRAEGAPARRWVDALGLAFAMAPWPVQHGFLGSDARVLSALVPVRIGLDACDAAAAGLAGAPDILEHPDGFLARFATVALPEAVTAGLGDRWHTDTLSFKMHPGGPGVDAAIDCAMQLNQDIGGLVPDEVAEITVESSLYTVVVEDRIARYVNPTGGPAGSLVLSVPYTVATALLLGRLTPGDFAPPRSQERQRWDLAAKVRLEHDVALTRSSMRCTAPFGEAIRQAGPRAHAWLEEVGGNWLVELVGDIEPPSTTFETATKLTGARVTVRLVDGRVFQRSLDVPVGGAGPQTREDHLDLVREKFVGTGGDPAVADGLAALESASPAEVADLLTRALSGGAR